MTDDVTTITPVTPGVETKPKAAPATPTAGGYVWGTGRRKTSVSRVRVRPGSGNIIVNGRPFDDYFPVIGHRTEILSVLKDTATDGKYDVWANCTGGGPTGQAGAMRLGLGRALFKVEPELEEALRSAGHLTRDSRTVERKKYGQAKARRRFQFSKR